MGDNTSLTKQGVRAVGGLAGGAALLTLGVLPSVFGIAAGGLAAIAGFSALSSRDEDDKRAGAVAAAAGTAAVLSKIAPLAIIKGAAAAALSIGAFALFGFGVWNGIKFLSGLRERS